MESVRPLPFQRLIRLGSGLTLTALLALSLFSILMSLLWSLFHTYSRLSLRSQDTSREIQIVRTVARQLTPGTGALTLYISLIRWLRIRAIGST